MLSLILQLTNLHLFPWQKPGAPRSKQKHTSLLRSRLETPTYYFCHVVLVKESHVTSSAFGSGKIIPLLDWKSTEVTLERGVNVKRGIIVDFLCNSLYIRLSGAHSNGS